MVTALRAHYGQTIPVVMVTADRSDECRRQLQGLGVPVLNKPVKAGKMRSVLNHLLNDSFAREETAKTDKRHGSVR